MALSLLALQFGHNINLKHANDRAVIGQPEGEYEDQTGHMGYSYNGTTNALKCYNGAKSCKFRCAALCTLFAHFFFHLFVKDLMSITLFNVPTRLVIYQWNLYNAGQTGWYQDRHETITPVDLTSNCQQQIELAGIAEYGSLQASDDQKVIVMITEPGATPTGKEYHITFNRAIGINANTGGFTNSNSYAKVRDKVLITSRDVHGDYKDVLSFLEYGLSQGEVATIMDFNDSGESL